MITSAVSLYRNAYSGINRVIWLLSVVMLINRSGTMVLAFLTLYITQLGFSLEKAGIVVAIYGIGSICGALAGGKLSDRIGFYYVQFGSLLMGGILFLVLGQMRSYLSICFVTFFLSMINESFRPANASAIAHYSTAKNRTQSFSLIRLAINIGWGIGAALGGFLASLDYSLLFWVDGFTNIAGSIMLVMLIPKVSKNEEQTMLLPGDEPAGIHDSPYKDKTFLFFLVFMTLFAICFFQLFSSVPVFFKEELQLDEFWIGAVMASNGIIIAMFEMVIVYKLEGRIPYLRLMFYGTILMAIAFLLLNLPLISGLLVASVFTLMLTLSEMVAMPFMNSYYIARSTGHNRGQYAGMYMMAWSIAQVIGSSSGTLVADRFGFNNLWWMVATISFLAAAGYLWLLRRSSN